MDVPFGLCTVFQNTELVANILKNQMIQIFKNGFLINGLVFSTPFSSFLSLVENKTFQVLFYITGF